jgi:hypothetical protein
MKKLMAGILSVSVFLGGCSHYYYVPNVQNVPLFREKDECRLSAMVAGGDETSCAEIQGAYSITKNIGVMANFMSAKGGTTSDKNYGKGNYFDGAIGYYKPINSHQVFEIYGGLGLSNQNHKYTNEYSGMDNGTSDLSFTKIFLQPSYGITFNSFDIAFSTRICRLSFNTVGNYIIGNTYEYDELNNIAQNKNYLFLEPAITVRGGWKHVKLQVQASTSSYAKSDLPFEDYHLGIGMYITIADRYRKATPDIK